MPSVAKGASAKHPIQTKSWVIGGAAILVALAAVKLGVHMYADGNYGYFRDELYYLACSEHLAWGYVDQPPLIALIAKFTRLTLGDSLTAIRFLSALAGAATVFLTGLIARELGGRRFAQGLAALSILVAPAFLALNHLFTMNAFEPLFWMGCACLVIRIIRTGNQRLWLWFGLLAGVGLENKHSMLIFGFGIVAGLLLTPERKLLWNPWIWVAGLLAFLIFLPNLIWNIQHHFPFLELQANIRSSHRNADLPPWQFLAQETLAMLPLSLPIWVAGLWFYFFAPDGKRFRALGWAWIITAVVIMALDPRTYYLFPAFPLVFAAGSVAWERWLTRPRLRGWKLAYPAFMLLAGAVLAPLALPLMPPETYIRYTQAIHLQQPRIENAMLGPLPQLFADQFGWPEMVATVARAYQSLSPDVRAKTAIFCQNYGEAGAVDLFGPKYGLPKAISGHQSYFLWGPRSYTGEDVLVLADNRQTLNKLFASVRKVGYVYHPYSMPYEHFEIFYCHGLKGSFQEMWPRVKNWD